MTTASAVSRTLRANGVPTVPDRMREGLYVSGKDRVYITAQHIARTEAERAVEAATEVLREHGYLTRPIAWNILVVANKDKDRATKSYRTQSAAAGVLIDEALFENGGRSALGPCHVSRGGRVYSDRGRTLGYVQKVGREWRIVEVSR